MSDPLTQIKIESLLSGFRNLGINQNNNIGQSEIIRFLNSKSRGGYTDPLIGKKLFQVLNITQMSKITVQEFVNGFLQFEEEVKNNANIFEHKLAQEREIFFKLDEQCKKYKNEQLNSEGLCENSLISCEITDIDIKQKLEGIKEIILKIIYNEKIEEIKFEIGGENIIQNKKFEFKPKSRKDHFEFIMKGINDRDQIFDIGNKIFSLDDVDSQEEYSIQIIIPEINDKEKVAAYINAKIIVYWSDYKYYEHQKRKAAKRLKKLIDATTKAQDFLLKVKEIYGNLVEKKQDIIVNFNNEKKILREGRRLIGVREKKQYIKTEKIEENKTKTEEKLKKQNVTSTTSKEEIKNSKLISNVPKLNNAKYEEIRKKPIEIPANEPKIIDNKLKEIVLPDKQNPIIYSHKILPEIIRNSFGEINQSIKQSITQKVNPPQVIENLHPPIVQDQTSTALIGTNEVNYNNLQGINTGVTLPVVQGDAAVRTGRWEQSEMTVQQSVTESPTKFITRSLKPISGGVSVSPTKYLDDQVNQPIEIGANLGNVNVEGYENVNVNMTSDVNIGDGNNVNVNMNAEGIGNEQTNFDTGVVEQNGYNVQQNMYNAGVNAYDVSGAQNNYGVKVEPNNYVLNAGQSNYGVNIEQNNYDASAGLGQNNYGISVEQNNYGVNVEQNNYGVNVEQNAYSTGVEQNAYDMGAQQNNYGVSVEQNVYDTGVEQNEYNMGVQQSINTNNNFLNPPTQNTVANNITSNITTSVYNLNQEGEINNQNLFQNEATESLYTSNYNINGMNNVQQPSFRKPIEQTKILPTIYQNLQGERILNRSTSKTKYEIRKKEAIVNESVLPVSFLPDQINQTITKKSTSPVKYIDNYSEYVQNVKNHSFVNIQTIQNGNVNYNEQQFLGNVNTEANLGNSNYSLGDGGITTTVVKFGNNQSVDPVSGTNIVAGWNNM